ncbi:MAG: isoleucine--tRNA ligase [Polyangia bacterium]
MDWKSTLNLPKTEFPMRADLARREPLWLKRWADERHYHKLLAAREAASAPAFVLHDGPPYATGGIHYGTLLNKVLKDIIVRSQLLMGKCARFVPGWDCHGLPIEHQVEKAAGGRAKLDTAEFRKRCEAHALKFVDVMRTDFRRLGCVGTWDQPYLTLSKGYEATIVRVLAAFARQGLLYRAKRPVHWCTTHQTALAEAEVEYADHSSPSIYVRFPLVPGQPAVEQIFGRAAATLVIWTTTPWTLAANLAVVANPQLVYAGIPVERGGRREYLIVARELAEAFLAACALPVPPKNEWIEIGGDRLAALRGVRYQHPFVGEPRSERDFRLTFAPHATLEAGTGLVHTAPGHGAEDYTVGRAEGLEIYAPVDGRGRYTAEVPLWAGQNVLEANPKIVAHLAATGFLINQPGETVRHQYPHCWRCKHPVLFRATSQWFARLGDLGDDNSLREKALAEIDRTQWIPTWGRDRISGMIEVRPDWCLSRQRLWGVPIPAYVCKACDEPFLLPEAMDFVATIFEVEGANAWFTRPTSELYPAGTRCPKCQGTDLEKGADIVDVWFESGVSWAAVADGKLVPKGEKVDLYLEGADQHRGWFHSSLLAAVAARGSAPYKAVLTHGWVLDERGKVYSKSEIEKARAAGVKTDYVEPGAWMEKNGAEVLRLWSAAADYQSDVVFSKTIMDQLGESYRKIRNTCRYLLSNLYDFVPSRDLVPDDKLRDLDRLALGFLRVRDQQVFDDYSKYVFHNVVRSLVDYVVTVSAEYLDPVKDVLYCEAPNSSSRRSVQTVFYEMVRTLATWMAPILCFSAQDVADELLRQTGEPFDVHGEEREERKPIEGAAWRWQNEIRARRELILAKVEPFRAVGHKSLEAKVTVRPYSGDREFWLRDRENLLETTVVSQLEITTDDASNGAEITVSEAGGPECPRCWRRTGSASGYATEPNLCTRCAAVVSLLEPR